jgi:predicted HTH transcriptional regulator
VSNIIGDATGKIWQYLETNGPSSATKIEKETEISSKDVQRAIGWLAKEDKLIIEKEGRVETISLK